MEFLDCQVIGYDACEVHVASNVLEHMLLYVICIL